MPGAGPEQKSPKPPSAEEFKAMLREGLANVAKKEQLDRMMGQIKSNTASLQSLEKRVEETNELNDKRFRAIEERIESGLSDPTSGGVSTSHRAAFDKARRSMRVWPVDG